MYIRIEDEVDKNHRHVYNFVVSTPAGGLEAKLHAKLDLFFAEVRGPGRRKWVEVSRWDRHCRRTNHVERPVIPQHVLAAARDDLIRRIAFEDS